MPEFQVTGAEALARLARVMKAEGDGKELKKNLSRRFRETGKPVVKKMKTNLATRLPQSGGAAAAFSNTTIGLRTRYSGKEVGVRIIARHPKHDIRAINKGILRHPTWGNRKRWSVTKVDADLLSKPLEESKSEVQRGVAQALVDTADTIASRI